MKEKKKRKKKKKRKRSKEWDGQPDRDLTVDDTRATGLAPSL
jgi:hypothetical protein